ncbi:hypothetical protein [Ancylobacter oerskovii]|uniref:Uncharacterized protein n=1 Tax=Ancylobacter oerskovii TaxID=459519 RepID=A0ABW4Z170_9HYPH|nr:hypothetical protein [Ancylobacter oerskovii]MBS7545071.1 hypothetical protein [Ancylobacter oerskovii]
MTMAGEQPCRFCGRENYAWPCKNSRDMEDSKSRICFAALIAHGGGEYSVNQQIAASIETCVRRDRQALAQKDRADER